MKNIDRFQFGKRIRELRNAKGWSQEELAMKSGIHFTYVGSVERGERNIGLDNILRLARALDQHPSTLFVGFQK